ncbi:hypothetical protein GGX14DRAFT_397722 [Mycena pura]|uniref:Uncharacterized protein n=1 Tax=Mycena pura TaxID=153505 RepID=A0AAD6YE80_9AGAR|nr:hypothetical protein GGX14DRAFT_397722 [Mycena pura]
MYEYISDNGTCPTVGGGATPGPACTVTHEAFELLLSFDSKPLFTSRTCKTPSAADRSQFGAVTLSFNMYGVPWEASPGTWGWNDAPGGSRANGQFDIQPSAPAWFSGPRRAQSPTASHLPSVGFSYPGVMFPHALASPAFGPTPHALSTGLPRGEYAEPAPQFPALDQQLDFFSDGSSNSGMPDAPQEDAFSVFMRAELDRHDNASSSRSTTSSLLYYEYVTVFHCGGFAKLASGQYATESSTGPSTPFSPSTPLDFGPDSLQLLLDITDVTFQLAQAFTRPFRM